ncbi:MAG: transcriptional regulator, partial [Candidatus Eisenbacteria sp.]|nr:transcriptional regulator [Candidatus Eisenbacteria bacterium]
DARPVVLFSIQPALHTPVAFKGIRYIRIGSYKKKLKDHPEKERALWSLLSGESFESSVAASRVTAGDVLKLIDYPSYFRLMDIPLPENRAGILERLEAENIVIRQVGDRFDISNVGAILFAADLGRFDRLARKAPRVIFYRGSDRLDTIKEQTGGKGYAIGFNGLVDYINDRLPQHEEIGTAFRREVRMFPKVAVRELVANALIHQDLTVSGTSPMVEIFSERLEISNPGPPLIDTLRFIDEPPQSRNEVIAGLLRRMEICEERGTGIDKVISSVEAHQLPAPDFRATPHATVAILHGPRSFSDMDRGDRVRACYQHACLCHVSGREMSNSTLRERLRIDKKNYSMVSRVIRDAVDQRLIKKKEGGSRKDTRYLPFWA